VSKHIDINQLLGEIGTSARAANDPWNLTRNYGGKVNDTALSPAVVADLGRSIESLTTEIQDSERIKQANAVSASSAPLSTAGSSSPGSSLLGGLLNLFPLASASPSSSASATVRRIPRRQSTNFLRRLVLQAR